jgi:hypothetical protein
MSAVHPTIQNILEAHGAPPARPDEPAKSMSTYVWYRGWECGWNAEAADWGFEGWDAYKGGCDLGAPHVSGRTWSDLLDEVDAEEWECADCPMADPSDCMLASYCPHRDGGKGGAS